VGISEVSDALTIIVSEETGNVSYAQKGRIRINVEPEELREQLKTLQVNNYTGDRRRRIRKGREDIETEA
jgi:diadenylate cyclase